MKPSWQEAPSRTEVLCGVNPILEQLRRDPSSVRKVFASSGTHGGAARVIEASRNAGVEVVIEDSCRLDQRAGGTRHQGVVAEIVPYRYAEWEDLLAQKPECLVLADQITDPRNLGAIIRSAEAAGAGGIILPRDRSAGVTLVTAKASAGATALIPVARVTNVARVLRELKDSGYWVIGLDLGAENDLFRFSFPPRPVLVIGSEGKGLRPLTRAACDHRVSIPMLGRVASLNVSVAAAIALFEWLRQRQQIDTARSG